MEGLLGPLVADVADGDGESEGEEPDEEEVAAKKRDGGESVDGGEDGEVPEENGVADAAEEGEPAGDAGLPVHNRVEEGEGENGAEENTDGELGGGWVGKPRRAEAGAGDKGPDGDRGPHPPGGAGAAGAAGAAHPFSGMELCEEDADGVPGAVGGREDLGIGLEIEGKVGPAEGGEGDEDDNCDAPGAGHAAEDLAEEREDDVEGDFDAHRPQVGKPRHESAGDVELHEEEVREQSLYTGGVEGDEADDDHGEVGRDDATETVAGVAAPGRRKARVAPPEEEAGEGEENGDEIVESVKTWGARLESNMGGHDAEG